MGFFKQLGIIFQVGDSNHIDILFQYPITFLLLTKYPSKAAHRRKGHGWDSFLRFQSVAARCHCFQVHSEAGHDDGECRTEQHYSPHGSQEGERGEEKRKGPVIMKSRPFPGSSPSPTLSPIRLQFLRCLLPHDSPLSDGHTNAWMHSWSKVSFDLIMFSRPNLQTIVCRDHCSTYEFWGGRHSNRNCKKDNKKWYLKEVFNFIGLFQIP